MSQFDEFSKKAKAQILSGFTFLKTKAQETIDVTKLQSNIRSLEERREECYLEIGQRVWVLFEMNKLEHFTAEDWSNILPRLEEIQQIEVHRKELDRQIQATREAAEQTLHQDHPKATEDLDSQSQDAHADPQSSDPA